MGMYFNPGALNFKCNLKSEIYVDKSQLIVFTNSRVNTAQRYLCVSRPRRFGKSMAADMLASYYGSGEETAALFDGLKIQQDASFTRHLNQYLVIKVDMQAFMTQSDSIPDMLALLSDELIFELEALYPDVRILRRNDLGSWCKSIFLQEGKQFVFLIDEWDCIMRYEHTEEDKQLYLDFLRNLFKDQPHVALAYMTGIFPIKKYGRHSTLNMFCEFSMNDSAQTSDCFGFTEEEVRGLCAQYHMDFQGAQDWFDGYRLTSYVSREPVTYSIYSPKSIVESMQRRKYGTYWNQTETYEALKRYIALNLDGLKDDVLAMLSGQSVPVYILNFQNDMEIFSTKDDVLTLLVHLGYLAYDPDSETVRIPNKEVATEFYNSIRTMDSWSEVLDSLQRSQALLQALWALDGDAVAAGVEQAHLQMPILKYNDENSLSCAIGLALYYAREYYTVIRELPAGKGFADLCYLPKPNHSDKPALLVELKWNHSTQAAIAQIKAKQYPAALRGYRGNLLLVGINYDKDTKAHTCSIEAWQC